MSRLRFLSVLVGVIVLLILTLWLVTTVVQLYETTATLSPLLGRLLVGLLLVLVLVLVGTLIYYVWLFRRRPTQSRPEAPRTKVEAAATSLQAVRQQVDQIQDDVARQALLGRSQRIEQNFARPAYRVVVFGTGSAGKTSLVNALLGQIADDVGAAMGTTAASQTHPMTLADIDREIWITDTPGILEAGVMGTDREQEARQLATEADLLLFLIDTDLRQSEYEPLRALIDIGKRSLLVLNKIDLYLDAELEQLLMQVRSRLRNVLAPADVVAVAAHPQSVRLETGDTIQPDPDLEALLDRMVTILRTEGETLIADNILMQAQQLGETVRRQVAAEREQRANEVIERFQWIGGGVIAVTPLPMVDLLATAAVNAQMVVELGRVYGCEVSLDQGRDLALSLAKTLTSLGVVKGTLQLLTLGLQANLATLVVGRAIQGVSAAYLTRIAGKSFGEYFQRNQDWGDGGMAEVVQEQFNLNRKDEFVQAFLKEAIARVVQPLEHQWRAELEENKD